MDRKIRWSLMPKTKQGVSKEKAEEVRRYVIWTGHRAKVVRVGKNRFKVYTSGPSVR